MQILDFMLLKSIPTLDFTPPPQKCAYYYRGNILSSFESYMSNLFNSYQSLWKHQRCIKKLESRQVALFPG